MKKTGEVATNMAKAVIEFVKIPILQTKDLRKLINLEISQEVNVIESAIDKNSLIKLLK